MQKFLKVLNKNRFDIWRYEYFYPKISKKYWLSVEKKWSNLEKNETLAKKLGIKDLYLKREDKNICGSHKTRGMAFRVSWALTKKQNKLVIPSTGNAAICAARYCQQAGIKLSIFVNPEIAKNKLQEIKKYEPEEIFLSKQAGTDANKFSKRTRTPNLRPSADPYSIPGFQSLGFELFEQMPDLNEDDAIFIFTTSGSSFLGLYQAFLNLKKLRALKSLPRLFAVQSGNNVSVAEFFDKRKFAGEDIKGFSKAKDTPRKKQIIEAIKNTGGSGVLILKDEISQMQKILKRAGIKTSEEGAAAAAAGRRTSAHADMRTCGQFKRVIVVLTGREW